MLVLGRKCDESIVLPQHGVVLTILEIRGDKVKVGIAAPSSVEVYRNEVWERIAQQDLRPRNRSSQPAKSDGQAVAT